MVVVIDYGRTVKKFGDEVNAKEYFDALTAKGRTVWLISKNSALRLGFI